jgi:putative sporulation protein YtxC
MDYYISIAQKNPYKANQLFLSLQELLIRLDKTGIVSSLGEISMGDRYFYQVSCRLKRRTQEKEVRQEIGAVMADYIFEYEEPDLIEKLVQREFQYFMADEVANIVRQTKEMLEQKRSGSWRSKGVQRREQLAKLITRYLHENRLLAVDGFIHFRLSEYRKLLAVFVKKAVEQYILDQEYKDFIELLRYFVTVQTPQVQMIHLIHGGKRKFQLLHTDGTPVDWQDVEQTRSHEDLLVSTLLNMAPERLVLHTKAPEENVIRTLMQIFEGRIILCNGCNECGFLLDFHGDA